MKANELMIGDWAFNSKNERCKICSIEGVGEPYAILDNYDKENDGCFETECDLTPIPLAKEILSKNNFEKHFDDDIVIYTHPQGIIIEMGINYKLFDDGHFFLRGIQHRLYYVHELQHALRLCSIEKEIEL